MTSYVSHGRGGSLASTTNSADSKENQQNGHCIRELLECKHLTDDQTNLAEKHRVYPTNGHLVSEMSSYEESQPMVLLNDSHVAADYL